MSSWECDCGQVNVLELHAGAVGLTPDELDEMDPEEIEAWQDANAPVQDCSKCGNQR